MDLAEFLVARVAEDEAAAKAALPHSPWGLRDDGVDSLGSESYKAWEAAEDFAQRFTAPRVLAECEAKRRIVDLWREAAEGLDEDDVAFTMSMSEYPSGVLTALSATLHRLALPYADHPSYDPEWKP